MAFWSGALQKCNKLEQARKVCGLSGLVFSREGSGLALSVTFGDSSPKGGATGEPGHSELPAESVILRKRVGLAYGGRP